MILNSQDKATVHIRNSDNVDFDVFDKVERALLYTLEEIAKSGLMTPSSCECPHISSLQERFFQVIGGDVLSGDRWAVLLFASGLASNSRNFACQLVETLGIRQTFQTSRHCWRRAPDHGFLATTHSTGAKRLEEGPQIEQLGQFSSIFMRLCACRASVPLPADDHRICEPSRSWDPTKPGGSPHHVSGTKET